MGNSKTSGDLEECVYYSKTIKEKIVINIHGGIICQ